MVCWGPTGAPQVYIELPSTSAIKQAVVTSRRVTVLNVSAVRAELTDGRLHLVAVDQEMPARPICAAWSEQRGLPEYAADLVQTAASKVLPRACPGVDPRTETDQFTYAKSTAKNLGGRHPRGDRLIADSEPTREGNEVADLNRIARTGVRQARHSCCRREHRDDVLQAGEGRVEPTAESRRVYRELIVTTPQLADSISGVILADETFHQKLSNGRTFRTTSGTSASSPGSRSTPGAKPLAGAPNETITEGLDGLRERVADYVRLGATFAKWRAVITIGDNTPSDRAVHANLHALARYAGLCQEGGLVPIVEPEVLMDGTHSLARCQQVSTAVLRSLFEELD